MKCLSYNENGILELNNRTKPSPDKGGILVKVESCGICGSDIKIRKFGNPRVKPGRIIGHEIAGTVVDSIGVEEYKIGDNIAVGADMPCGCCDSCNINELDNCCGDYAIGHELDGGFSEFIILDNNTLKKGPVAKFRNIPFELATLAEPLGCCLNGYHRANSRNYDSVLIMGAGPIGWMLAVLAHLKGIKFIFIADLVKERLLLGKNLNFEYQLIELGVDSVSQKLTKFLGKPYANLIFTANNNVLSHQMAMKYMGPFSTINFFGGLPSKTKPIQIDTNEIHYKQYQLTGSHGSNPSQHKAALQIIQENPQLFKSLISKSFPISEFENAFETSTLPESCKIVINPND